LQAGRTALSSIVEIDPALAEAETLELRSTGVPASQPRRRKVDVF
jgi:hypothetical protein